MITPARVRSPLAAALTAAVMVVLFPAPSAHADFPNRPARVVPVFDGVERQEWDLRTPAGAPVSAQVLVVSKPDAISVRAELAQDRVPGLENVQSIARRKRPDGGVAAINGGFWHNQPVGDPNSYLARGGRLISESATQGSLARGTFGVTADGLALVDRIDTAVSIGPDGAPDQWASVTGVNRFDLVAAREDDEPPEPWEDTGNETYLFTPAYGQSVTLGPADEQRGRDEATAIAVPGLAVPASGLSEPAQAGQAQTVQAGQTLSIPPDGVLVVAYGNHRGPVQQALPEGASVRARTEITTIQRNRNDLWASIREGLAAGPLIVRDGQQANPATWEGEGFPGGHWAGRHPRSAAGVRPNGEILLVAVDGRLPEHSAGMTLPELASFLLHLGAVDAISLDGGGSTTMAVDGVVTNRPSNGLRPVASALVLYHHHTFVHTERFFGAGREETAAQIALASYPDGADEVLLAAGDRFPDALAGGPLSSAWGAPLLLSHRTSVPSATLQAITSLGAARVTILGGSAAVGDEVVDALRSRGLDVRRIAGPARAETAAQIAASLPGAGDRVFVAFEGGFPDALSAAAPAGMLGAPILLTATDRLSDVTRNRIAAGVGQVVLVGGSAVISPAVEQEIRALPTAPQVIRLAGPNRFGTARAVNEWAEAHVQGLDPTGLVVATGENFPDALAGGPFAASRDQLLMIVPRHDVHAEGHASTYLNARGQGPLETVSLLGGHAVLSSYQEWQLDLLAGP